MFVLNVVIVTCALLFKCEAGFVDTLPKCSINNDECLRDLYQNSLRSIGKQGIPEIDIPPTDPMNISNVSVTVMDAIKITMTEGVVKGISTCQIKTFHIDLEKLSATQEIVCDLTIKGQVAVEGSSPAIQSFFGTTSIDGNGKGKVKLEKLYLGFDFPLRPTKKEDGNIYFKITFENVKYKYDIEKATFAAEKIFIGKDDITKIVVPYLNSNFKAMMKTFGKAFLDKAVEFYFDFEKKFFEGIPTKNYIIEDLAPYVNN